jgi:hypothetical protein
MAALFDPVIGYPKEMGRKMAYGICWDAAGSIGLVQHNFALGYCASIHEIGRKNVSWQNMHSKSTPANECAVTASPHFLGRINGCIFLNLGLNCGVWATPVGLCDSLTNTQPHENGNGPQGMRNWPNLALHRSPTFDEHIIHEAISKQVKSGLKMIRYRNRPQDWGSKIRADWTCNISLLISDLTSLSTEHHIWPIFPTADAILKSLKYSTCFAGRVKPDQRCYRLQLPTHEMAFKHTRDRGNSSHWLIVNTSDTAQTSDSGDGRLWSSEIVQCIP